MGKGEEGRYIDEEEILEIANHLEDHLDEVSRASVQPEEVYGPHPHEERSHRVQDPNLVVALHYLSNPVFVDLQGDVCRAKVKGVAFHWVLNLLLYMQDLSSNYQ
mmetsp:Transcript_18836/g.13658  ORF Transcript_18836/g.13658 Transcript_18836/m.13658 type:complete len:105 (+) Transcript_18836:712-1026(+)